MLFIHMLSQHLEMLSILEENGFSPVSYSGYILKKRTQSVIYEFDIINRCVSFSYKEYRITFEFRYFNKLSTSLVFSNNTEKGDFFFKEASKILIPNIDLLEEMFSVFPESEPVVHLFFNCTKVDIENRELLIDFDLEWSGRYSECHDYIHDYFHCSSFLVSDKGVEFLELLETDK